ncbi:hypothetical protein PG988_002679 [Apiospora saccharicola]
MRLILFLLLLGTFCELSYQIGFARPAFVVPLKAGGSPNMLWKIGDVERIEFDTPWLEYTIEFWQQSLLGGGARLASKPVYQLISPETRGQELPQVINWTVTTDEFDINDSPTFFFWLKEIRDSKDKKPARQSSAYFNITETPADTSPTTNQFPSTASTATSTTSSEAYLPSSSTSNVSVNQPTATKNNEPSVTASGQRSSNQQSMDLSTGATLSIGAGVGVISLAAIACTVMLFLNRKKGGRTPGSGSGVLSIPTFPNQTQQQQYQRQQSILPPPYGMAETFTANEPPKESTPYYI